MIRLVIGAVLSTAVLFGFGGWFWMMSPYPHMMIKPLPNEEASIKVIKETLPESGVYFFPFADQATMMDPNGEASKAFVAKHEAGPFLRIFIRYEGVKLMDPMVFGMGLAHYFVASLLMGILLKLAAPGLAGYLPRVLFVTLAGVFASFAITLQQPIWFHYPWTFSLMLAAYDAVSWLLAGIVLAMVIRPSRG